MAINKNVNEFEVKKALKAEKVVGDKAARILQGSLIKFIGIETVSHTGKMMASTVKSLMRNSGLSALIIRSPKYGFILNYGFEGVKSNGISMKLQPTNHIADAIEKSSILEILATELTSIKGDKVMASINFNPRG